MSEKKTMTIEIDMDKESVVIVNEDRPDALFFGTPKRASSVYLWAITHMEQVCPAIWMEFMKFFFDNREGLKKDMVSFETKIQSKRN